ncbi:MAG: hypothetical protein AUK35_00355 [Zetaproteobacteria bacterium CG2_30_46_52]|nr:MAG: hypothetical protein AUK35_00355 [Zetaproteobacteria bacterium CG2_30_46_52]
MRVLFFKLFSAFILAMFVSSCTTELQENIVGEWKGTDHAEQTASFVFHADGNVKMMQGKNVLDSQSVSGSVTWSLDTEKNPMHLTLQIKPAAGGEARDFPMLVRFVSENQMQLRMNKEMTPGVPLFSEQDTNNLILLTKQ